MIKSFWTFRVLILVYLFFTYSITSEICKSVRHLIIFCETFGKILLVYYYYVFVNYLATIHEFDSRFTKKEINMVLVFQGIHKMRFI